jgi:hypothetical protein
VPVRGFDGLSCGRARPPILPRAPPAGSMQATVLLLHEQPHQEVEQAGDEEHHREKVVAASAMAPGWLFPAGQALTVAFLHGNE